MKKSIFELSPQDREELGKKSKQEALERAAKVGGSIAITEVIDGKMWIINEYLDGRKEKVRQID